MVRLSLLLVLALGAGACTSPAARRASIPSEEGRTTTGGTLTTLYRGGDILTMVGDAPEYVEALVISDGRILFAGAESAARARAGDATTVVDLDGRTMLPGFIDGHGHVAHAIEFQRYRYLRTPDVRDVSGLVAALEAHASKIGVAPGDWIVGYGHDPAALVEQRHPTATELDGVSTEHPVLLMSASGEVGVANHAALVRTGVARDIPPPPRDGTTRSAAARRPTGLLGQRDYARVRAAIPALTPQQVATFTDMAMRDVASRGLTTVTEGDTTASQWRLLVEAEARGALTADVVAYANDTQAATRGMAAHTSARLVADTTSGSPGRVRLAGLAFWTSRSAGVGTGWRSPSPTAPFHDAAHGPHEERIAASAQLRVAIDTWYPTRHQILVHVDGDSDADAVLTAIDAAQKTHGVADRRPIVVQCGIYRDDHLAAMQAMGVIPSFSPAWPADAVGRCQAAPGQAEGQQRAAMAAVAGRGMPYTIHGDGTFVPRDVLRVVGAAVSRPTPATADAAGPGSTLTAYQALLAVTRHAAFALFEEGRKGTLEPGKRADLVILERNPLKVEPAAIGAIRVLQTIKDGVTVYRAH